jgi:pSer/pThr/pTyr-binding forkhead associated (FHA) protein
MGGIYPLQAAGVTIGRDESCDIAFPEDATASRRHARIASEDGQWMIRDEGSSNGTFVNGVKVTEQVLKSGDEITVGSTRLRFET